MISDEAREVLLNSTKDDQIRQILADVLTRESTILSDYGSEIDSVTLSLRNLDDESLDEVRAASPETIDRELRKIDQALGHLSMAFFGLLDKIPDPARDEE